MGYGGVIAPDKGAHDRAEQMADALGLDVTYGSKVRDVATGRLSDFEITVEPGKHYLVVDDICDGGGTFIGLGEKIREQGAFADLYVTHGIFSKGTTELKKIYKNIYTTDSRIRCERNDVYNIRILKDMENYNA
jgi:ribose-phosphate pyrophosphokinase